MYLRPVKYQTGGISTAASIVSEDEIESVEAEIESQVFCVPQFKDVPINISDDELQLMSIMMNHVTIETATLPRMYLHTNEIISLAFVRTSNANLTLEESIEFEAVKSSTTQIMHCSCSAHLKMKELEKGSDAAYEFCLLLSSLQTLDATKQFKDQSGAQCVTTLFNFVCKRARTMQTYYAKAENLQVSCVAYDRRNNQVKLFNATPDFIGHSGHEGIVTVGEVQSSPLVQMMVAGLGHLSQPHTRYLLGVVVGKDRSVTLYLLENELERKTHNLEVYSGKITMKACINCSIVQF